MFAIYNNMTRGSLINFFLFPFHLTTTYLSLVFTLLLLLLLQLCLLILPLWVFLRNLVGEISKQEIQAAWSTRDVEDTFNPTHLMGC